MQVKIGKLFITDKPKVSTSSDDVVSKVKNKIMMIIYKKH